MKRVLIVADVPFWYRKKGNQQRISELVNFLTDYYSVSVFLWGMRSRPAIATLLLSVSIP